MSLNHLFTVRQSKPIYGLGLFTMLAGVFILLAWQGMFSVWQPLSVTFPSLSFNSGLSFVLLGGGLLMTLRQQKKGAVVLAGMVFLLAGSTFLEGWLDLNWQIDHLLFQHPDVKIPHASYHMANHTALTFTALALALMVLNRGQGFPHGYAIVGLLSGLVLGISLADLLDAGNIRKDWVFETRMPLLTAIILTLFSSILLILSWQQEKRRLGSFPYWVPFHLFLLIMVFTFTIWYAVPHAKEFQHHFHETLHAFGPIFVGVVALMLALVMYFFQSARERAFIAEQRNQELQASETMRGLLVALVESSEDAIISTSRTGKITSWNRGAKNIFDYETTQIMGQDMAMILPQEHLSPAQSGISNPGAYSISHFNGVGRNRDGRNIPLFITLSPIRNDQGNVIGLSRIMRDQSQHLELEARLHQQQEQLTRLAQLGTLGEMTGMLAHELGQPLAAISIFAQGCLELVAGDHRHSEALREGLTALQQESKRLNELFANIRNLIRRRPMEEEAILVDIKEVIEDMYNLISLECSRKHIPLQLNLCNHPLWVRVFPVQLQQVILNLIKNSVDALTSTPTSSPFIRLSTDFIKDQALLTVTNNGPTIHPEVVAHMFDPFFTTKPGGTGLGLSICRTLVEGFGGAIWVETQIQGETSFHITFPLWKEEDHAP
ncbi:MAG: PAS domain S-box protein [Magnetococcales bacterium]|nr:PAS domain S-box protein [Magnetococcales bacterium]